MHRLWYLLLFFTPIPKAAAQRAAPAPAPRRAVIVTLKQCCPDRAWPAAEKRLTDELQALQFQVTRVAGRAQDPTARQAELVKLTHTHGAACVLRLVRLPKRGGGVELSLTEPFTQKVILRSLVVRLTTARAAAILVLRVVELLREHLLVAVRPARARKRAPKREPKRAVPTPLFINNPSSPRRPRKTLRFGLRLDGGVVGGPGGVGAQGLLALAARWSPLSRLSLELQATVSPGGERISHRGAKAAFHLASFRLCALWESITRGRWRPALGLGAGVVIPWVRGLGDPRYVAQRDVKVSADLSALAQLAVVLSRRLWLRFELLLGLAVPRFAIWYGSEDAARFGRPYLAGTLGLELRLP